VALAPIAGPKQAKQCRLGACETKFHSPPGLFRQFLYGVLGSSLSSGAARRRLQIRYEALVDGVGNAPLEAPQRLLAGLAWFLDNDGLHFDHSVGYAHNASLFRRAALERVGAYPSQSLGYDAALDADFSGIAHGVDPRRGDKELRRSEWFYMYRWGVSSVHVSAQLLRTSIGKLASSQSWKGASSCLLIGGGTT
jgi:hypothetical protein